MEQFTNRSAIAMWICAPTLLLVMVVGTFFLVSNGMPDKNPALIAGMMGLLWLVVLWFTYLAASTGITYVQVERGSSVSVVRRYPHKTVRRTLARDQVRQAEVVEVRDSESGDVFIARVKVADGDEFNLASTNSRESCEEACSRFNAALFGSSTRRASR